MVHKSSETGYISVIGSINISNWDSWNVVHNRKSIISKVKSSIRCLALVHRMEGGSRTVVRGTWECVAMSIRLLHNQRSRCQVAVCYFSFPPCTLTTIVKLSHPLLILSNLSTLFSSNIFWLPGEKKRFMYRSHRLSVHGAPGVTPSSGLEWKNKRVLTDASSYLKTWWYRLRLACMFRLTFSISVEA